MNFRTKLFYSFISLGLMSTLLALFIIYGEASRLIFNEIRSKILSLVMTSEKLINPIDLERVIKSHGETKLQAYHNLRKELIQIQELNRRSDNYVQFVYIIQKHPDSENYFFVIDSGTKEGKEPSRFGDIYPFYFEEPKDLKHPFATTHVSDKEGSWLTGYAPILNSEGQVLGLLGIDVLTQEVYLEFEKLLLYGLVAFAISICVAIIFACFLSKLVSSSLSVLCETVFCIGRGEFSKRSLLHTRDEFNELSLAINNMARGLEERERLKMGFTRYVSQYALEELLKLDQPISLEGERKKVTILFSDIRQFTALAEKLPPEEVLVLLNEYFEEMIDVIFHYGGTLDKFIGDGMMVEFGAPLDDTLQELHATLAAIHMHLRLEKLSDKWEREGKKRFKMGIGIHTGLAVLGNIGSEKRMEYTAIGDAVNVASRLEGATKKSGKSIIISHSVYEKITDHFIFENLQQIQLPGRTESIQAYAIDPHAQKNLAQFK